MLRSFDRLMRVDPGFQPERVLTLRVPMPTNLTKQPQQAAYYGRLLERMQRMPGVNSAGSDCAAAAGRGRRQRHFRTCRAGRYRRASRNW